MPSNLSKKLGEFLLQTREAMGMSQTKFGQMIGLKRNQVGLYEKGESEADLALVERVCKILKRDPSDLLGRPQSVRQPTEEEIADFILGAIEARTELENLKRQIEEDRDIQSKV